MSENDKFRLTLDNDGSPCLDIYGIISPSTKLTASFSAYDERYKVEDQLNNVLKDIQKLMRRRIDLFMHIRMLET